MKNLKKTLMTLSLAFVMVFSTLLLVACGETPPTDTRELTVNSQLKTQTDSIISFISSKVYNNLTGQKDYTVQEVKNLGGDFANLNYYVKVGSLKDFGEVKSLEFNGTKFDTAKSVFRVSVGNNSFIADNVYYVTREKDLYVAAPIVAYETSVSSKFKINDKEVDLGTIANTTALTIETIGFMSGAESTIQAVQNKTNEYDLTIKESTTWVQVTYTGLNENDVFLTKKVTDGQFIRYGLTGLDKKDGTSNTEKVFAFYPIDHGADLTDKDVISKFDGKTRDYYIYCVGKGSAKLKLNLNIYQAPAQGE